MPMLTPSRVAIVVLCLSLASFLWTLGFAHQPTQPARPIIDHYDHKNVHSEPIIPAPSLATPTPTPTQHATGLGGHTGDGLLNEGGANATRVRRPASTHSSKASATAHSSGFCNEVRGAPHVMVILRTSKAEITKKLPTHLQGLLSCVPNFAIFSDHAGELDGVPIYNALDAIGTEVKRTHDEFHEYQLMHADAEHKPDVGKTKRLDKWKFLPMVYKTYKLNPHAKFYVFIEADTSLSWTNILQWVHRLDYRIPYYAGSPTFINSVQLAQRGSGILLSQGALRRYVNSYDELYTSKWEVALGKGCCGDLALAQALGDAHVEFYSSWPLMQGEHPASLDYTRVHWCVPAVSWHHTNDQVLDELWATQKNWTAKYGWEKPYLYRDAFESFVSPHMETNKEKWDNLSQDTKIVAPQGRQQQIKEEEERSKKHKQEEEAKKGNERAKMIMSAKPFSKPPTAPSKRRRDNKKEKEVDWDKIGEMYKDAGDSVDKCQKSCEAIEDCLQWRYASNKGDGECHLGKVLRLGKKTSESDDKWTSGWMVNRIKKVTKEWECKEAQWRFYQ